VQNRLNISRLNAKPSVQLDGKVFKPSIILGGLRMEEPDAYRRSIAQVGQTVQRGRDE
jgi:hypothetical protein